MVPFWWATYRRPSGPNCKEVGLIELAFCSKPLPKLTWPATCAAELSASTSRRLARAATDTTTNANLALAERLSAGPNDFAFHASIGYVIQLKMNLILPHISSGLPQFVRRQRYYPARYQIF